jgi:hypothetical protein
VPNSRYNTVDFNIETALQDKEKLLRSMVLMTQFMAAFGHQFVTDT